MKSVFSFLAGVALIAAGAAAQVPLNTGFEAPDFAPGQLAGQNGWVEINGNNGSPTSNFSIVNNAALAFGGEQFVETNTGTWGEFPNNTARYAWANTPLGGVIDASVRVNVINPTGNTIVTGGGIALYGTNAATGDTLIGIMRLLTNGQLQLFNGAGQGIGFNPNALFPLGQYNEMRIVADLATGTMQYVVNGTVLNPFLGTFSPTFASGIGFSDADLYAVRGGTGTGGGIVRWDNMSVVPSHGSLALLGLAGLVTARRRR